MTTPRSPVTVPAQLRIDVGRPSPLTVQVTPVGEVDLATAHILLDSLLRVLREQASAILDIDLAGVTFLDCSGVSALVAARNVAAQAGRQVTVSNPRPIVRRVLELTGLLDAVTAPIDRPQPPRADHASKIGTAPATAPRPSHMMAAA